MDIKDAIEASSNCASVSSAVRSLDMVSPINLSDRDKALLTEAKAHLSMIKMNLELSVLNAKKQLQGQKNTD